METKTSWRGHAGRFYSRTDEKQDRRKSALLALVLYTNQGPERSHRYGRVTLWVRGAVTLGPWRLGASPVSGSSLQYQSAQRTSVLMQIGSYARRCVHTSGITCTVSHENIMCVGRRAPTHSATVLSTNEFRQCLLVFLMRKLKNKVPTPLCFVLQTGFLFLLVSKECGGSGGGVVGEVRLATGPFLLHF